MLFLEELHIFVWLHLHGVITFSHLINNQKQFFFWWTFISTACILTLLILVHNWFFPFYRMGKRNRIDPGQIQTWLKQFLHGSLSNFCWRRVTDLQRNHPKTISLTLFSSLLYFFLFLLLNWLSTIFVPDSLESLQLQDSVVFLNAKGTEQKMSTFPSGKCTHIISL